ncbi:MAG: 4Fe-4S binding protein [Oscillospiraceae bacterium]|nr:4Fe-4S binding protein [Oscillospiraceae bacterium]
MSGNIIFTVTANCRDCYRCLRNCPVKAIRVSGGQAQIDDTLCIHCGTCVRECPQNAKKIHSDLEAVKDLVKSRPVVASIAPSFAAVYSGKMTNRLPSALRQLGFKYVTETAEGAKYITEKSFEQGQRGNICSACPAVINYIEKYQPELMDYLISVSTPMVAHGRLLKSRYPDCAVVFIGPCAAKIGEAQRPDNLGAVDYVLTFDELDQWMGEDGISLNYCPESGFDNSSSIGDARLFPLDGGMLATGAINSELSSKDTLFIHGANAVLDLFHDKKTLGVLKYIEALFCTGGCIGGPGITNNKSIFERKRDVLSYWENAGDTIVEDAEDIPHFAQYSTKTANFDDVTQNQINMVLAQTGKSDPALQLNCNACGYKTCIDCAVAIVRGIAEPEMCMPYMKRLAQQRTDRIIETTPSGIVVLNSDLFMIHFNPAFQKMFKLSTGMLGRRISVLLDAEGYELMQSGVMDEFQSIKGTNGTRYHEVLYALREENQYVGIYSDISKLEMTEEQLGIVKEQTVYHAREFLEHQIRFSQEMAHFLGQSTAKSEEIARRLISLYEQEGNGGHI